MCLRDRSEIEDIDVFRREVENADEVDCYDIEDIDVDNADEVDVDMVVAERRPTQAPTQPASPPPLRRRRLFRSRSPESRSPSRRPWQLA